jgi:hypothetical protein
VLHGRRIGSDGQVAVALVWGANSHDGKTSHSGLVEAEVVDNRNTIYGRLEFAQKTAEDLALGTFTPETRFNVSALSLGYIREVAKTRGATLGVGFHGTLNLVPSSLEPSYGSRTPVGGMVFLRLRPVHGAHTMNQSPAPMRHDHDGER